MIDDKVNRESGEKSPNARRAGSEITRRDVIISGLYAGGALALGGGIIGTGIYLFMNGGCGRAGSYSSVDTKSTERYRGLTAETAKQYVSELEKKLDDEAKECIARLESVKKAKTTIPIHTYEDLNRIRQNLKGDYVLMNDIDLTGKPDWEPIGDREHTFQGILNGNGKVISGLRIERPKKESLGFFGEVGKNGLIGYLGLKDIELRGFIQIGGIAACNYGNIILSNASGETSGRICVGGLIGLNKGNIMKSYSKVKVKDIPNEECLNLGGIAGDNRGNIFECYNNENVIGFSSIGGIAGINGGIVIKSFNSGYAEGSRDSGSIVGSNYIGELIFCKPSKNAEGRRNIGELIGYSHLGLVVSESPLSERAIGSYYRTKILIIPKEDR